MSVPRKLGGVVAVLRLTFSRRLTTRPFVSVVSTAVVSTWDTTPLMVNCWPMLREHRVGLEIAA